MTSQSDLADLRRENQELREGFEKLRRENEALQEKVQLFDDLEKRRLEIYHSNMDKTKKMTEDRKEKEQEIIKLKEENRRLKINLEAANIMPRSDNDNSEHVKRLESQIQMYKEFMNEGLERVRDVQMEEEEEEEGEDDDTDEEESEDLTKGFEEILTMDLAEVWRGLHNSTSLVEMDRFREQFQMYLQYVESEYQKSLQKKGKITTLPVAPAPLSAALMQAYELLVKRDPREMEGILEKRGEGSGQKTDEKQQQQQQKMVVDEVETECVICLTELHEIRREQLKCSECSKAYHQECILKWLKTNSTCPNCRSSMPNPIDFPQLC